MKVDIDSKESSSEKKKEEETADAEEVSSQDKKDKGARQKVKKGGKGENEKKYDELKSAYDALEKERDDLKEKLLRLHAETENFKKRITKEKDDFVRYSNEKIVKELLPVIDNLERAVDHAREAGESGALLEGVEMTLSLFIQGLEGLGVSQLSSVGEPFDPERHEAVQQIESGDHDPNVVVSEFQKGYMLHERLIRPAMVVVSKK